MYSWHVDLKHEAQTSLHFLLQPCRHVKVSKSDLCHSCSYLKPENGSIMSVSHFLILQLLLLCVCVHLLFFLTALGQFANAPTGFLAVRRKNEGAQSGTQRRLPHAAFNKSISPPSSSFPSPSLFPLCSPLPLTVLF